MPIYSDISLLQPKMARMISRLHEYLIDAHETGRTQTRFEVFETFRDPMRQKDLIRKGTTKAGPFQSAHQFGLGADLVPYITPEEARILGEKIGEAVFPGWSWHSSHDYAFLHAAAPKFGLTCPIKWDPCHVQHPHFANLRLHWTRLFE